MRLSVFLPNPLSSSFLHFGFRGFESSVAYHRKSSEERKNVELEAVKFELQQLQASFEQGSRDFKTQQSRAAAAEDRSRAARIEVARLRRMLEAPLTQRYHLLAPA